MPSPPPPESITITIDSSIESGGTHTISIKEYAADEDGANIIDFLDGDNLADVFIKYGGLGDNQPDEFHFDLTGFDDDFDITIKSEGTEDTFYMVIDRSPTTTYSTAGNGVMTINYTGSDGNPHVVTIDPGDASIVVNLSCFTPGTLIETPAGQIPVEDLVVSDQVTTLDNGPQTLRWIGRRRLEFGADTNKHKPILHPAGSLGPNCPSRDLVVSPQHKMFLTGEAVTKISGSTQILAASKAMIGHNGIRQLSGKRHAEYISLLFDRHEIIFAENAATESFRPGPMAIRSLPNLDKKELFELILDLGQPSEDALYKLARPKTKNRSVRNIFKVARENGEADMGLSSDNAFSSCRIPEPVKRKNSPNAVLERAHLQLVSFRSQGIFSTSRAFGRH